MLLLLLLLLPLDDYFLLVDARAHGDGLCCKFLLPGAFIKTHAGVYHKNVRAEFASLVSTYVTHHVTHTLTPFRFVDV